MILKVDEHFWVKLHRLPIYRMSVNNTNKFPTKNGHIFSNIGKLLSILIILKTKFWKTIEKMTFLNKWTAFLDQTDFFLSIFSPVNAFISEEKTNYSKLFIINFESRCRAADLYYSKHVSQYLFFAKKITLYIFFKLVFRKT